MVSGGKFGLTVVLIQIAFIIIFAFFVEYGEDLDARNLKHGQDPPQGGQDPKDNSLNAYYPMFQDINAMIFIGVGFLYTFLKKYGFTGVGMTMLLAAISIQLAIISQNWWSSPDGKIYIDVVSLIGGEFAAASAVIAFGGVFGKINPLQMVIFTVIEVLIYTTNEHLCETYLQISDIGGSVSLHLFAAIFGCAVAYMVDRKANVQDNPNEGNSYHSNISCFIGTLLLWAFWPSFNSSLASGDRQHRSVMNTHLSLLASCLTAFATSSLLNKERKFTMSHIQNATLAGGVAIGATSDLMVQPYGALIIGALGGCLSVLGFTYVSPFLAKVKVYDPCGINSLHGIPGLLAGFSSIVVALLANEKNYGQRFFTRLTDF